jgi:galactokinase
MRTWNNLYKMLKNGEMDQSLIQTGCEDINAYRTRATEVMNGFEKTFGVKEDTLAALCSAPGRTEICGNHTDHQHGHVLAAAVNLDFLACVSPNGTQTVHFQSEGWPMTTVDLSDLKQQEAEKETTASLVRGVMAELAKAGYTIGGFDMYAVSNVLPGSGLSSSAACEILLGVAGNHLFCQDELDAVTLAKIGQKAENQYFGKPSGLMDQTASSVGDAVAIDFADPSAPIVRSVTANLEELGLALCIVDCGADHAALTGEYASIPREMEKVAAFFGKKVLREVQEEEVLKAMPQLRRAVGDRAVLRALHFYADDRRAVEEADALERRDRDAFLQLVKESGRSSWELLQNITPAGAVEAQDMAIALEAAEIALNGKGACRVHGGGFAGTIQAFVPTESVSEFCEKMELMLRKGCCHVLNIRPTGGIVL